MKIRPKLPYSLFFLIISIVGCAVLKIDVDVYKGPLSNSEDMQEKQLVAMVAGTKDLLVQLRNNLELESLEKNKEILQDNEYEKRKELITNLKGWINVDSTGSAKLSGVGSHIDKNGHLVMSDPKPYISRTMQGTTTVITYTLNFKDTTFGTSYDIFTSKLASNVNDILEFFENKEKKNNTEFIKYLEKGEIGTDTTKLRDELLSFAENVLMCVKYSRTMGTVKDWGFIKDSLKVNSYVTVLQAIGNSIISQLNELYYQKAYKDEIEKDSARNNELWAMKQATTPQPKEVLDTFVKEVKESKEREMRKQKEYEKEIGIKVAGFKSLCPDDEAFSAYNNLEKDYEQFYGSSSAYTKKKQETYNVKDADSKNYNSTNEIINTDEKFHLVLNKLDPGTTTSFKDMGEKIVNALAKEYQGEQSTARKEKLITAKQIMESLVKEDEFTKKDENSFTKILYAIKEIVKTRHETKLNDALIEKDRFDKAREIFDLAGEYKNAKDGEKKYADAESKIKDNIGKVLEKFNLAEERPTTEGIIWQLRFIIQDKLDTEQNKPETERNSKEIEQYKNALAVVKDDLRATGTMVAKNKDAKDTKDVFDQVIALLRHQHIQAVFKYGANSRQANDIDEALKLAYSYRSNMVYIRPPSTYLRNSFPSTSLQTDPGLAWKNMLSTHALRNTPFIDDIFNLTGNKSQKGLAIADIDKQYWQNINSVRVAGAGNTNYVVAKDDVGNWYVKRYSSDPKDIIQSAKKLALFNLGAPGMMNVDLVNRLSSKIDQEKVQQQQQQDQYNAPDGENKAPEVTEKKPDANRTTLEQIFDKYQNEYTEQTIEDYEMLRGILKNTNGSGTARIQNDIKKAWNENTDTKIFLGTLTARMDIADNYLETAYNELSEIPEKEKSVEEKDTKGKKGRAMRIIDALREINNFQKMLKSEIRDLELAKPFSVKLQNKEKDKIGKEKELESSKEDMKEKKSELGQAEEKKKECENNFNEQNSKFIIAEAKYQAYTGDENTDETKKGYKVTMAEEQAKLNLFRDASGSATSEWEKLNKAYGSATDIVEEKEGALVSAEKDVKGAQDDLDTAVRADQYAVKAVTNVVRTVLMGMTEKRIDVVNVYETGIMFIGDAIKENN